MILVLPSPAPIEIGRTKAPDRLSWPPPSILVDTSEQTPIAFGHIPALWEEGAPVHYGQIDPRPDPLFRKLSTPYPWRCVRANLSEGDYSLEDPRTPGAPIPNWCAIETKRGDLVASMTVGRERLAAEFARLAPYRYPALVSCVSAERLIGIDGLRQPRAAQGREACLLGSVIGLANDYRIPPHMMPDRVTAEYMVAWLLLRNWRTWLVEVPEGLRECRRLAECEKAAKGEAVRA